MRRSLRRTFFRPEAPNVTRKYESKHWYACDADGRSVGRSLGRSVTWLPNFLGWVDLFTHGAPQARFARGAPLKIGSNQVIFIDWLRKSVKIDELNCGVKSILSMFHGFNDGSPSLFFFWHELDSNNWSANMKMRNVENYHTHNFHFKTLYFLH